LRYYRDIILTVIAVCLVVLIVQLHMANRDLTSISNRNLEARDLQRVIICSQDKCGDTVNVRGTVAVENHQLSPPGSAMLGTTLPLKVEVANWRDLASPLTGPIPVKIER